MKYDPKLPYIQFRECQWDYHPTFEGAGFYIFINERDEGGPFHDFATAATHLMETKGLTPANEPYTVNRDAPDYYNQPYI